MDEFLCSEQLPISYYLLLLVGSSAIGGVFCYWWGLLLLVGSSAIGGVFCYRCGILLLLGSSAIGGVFCYWWGLLLLWGISIPKTDPREYVCNSFPYQNNVGLLGVAEFAKTFFECLQSLPLFPI